MTDKELEKAKHSLKRRSRKRGSRSRGHDIKEVVTELMKELETEKEEKQKEEAKGKEGLQKVISENNDGADELKSKLDEPLPLGTERPKNLETAIGAEQSLAAEEAENLILRPYQRRAIKYENRRAGDETPGNAKGDYKTAQRRLTETDENKKRDDDLTNPSKIQYSNNPLQKEVYQSIEGRQMKKEEADEQAAHFGARTFYEPKKPKKENKL